MTLIPEGNIDLHIERTVRFVDDSDLSLKFACIAAGPVVGGYDGTTQEIAKRTKRSVSQVENWAHAKWMYDVGRKYDMRLARNLWRELPVTHWARAWDIQTGGYNALYYLEQASYNDWSAAGMMAEFDKEREAGHAPLLLHRAKLSFFGLASELYKQAVRLTESQRVAVLSVIDSFKVEA